MNYENEQLRMSDYKVMRTAAGYYVGREYYDNEMKAMMPYDRLTNYFEKPSEAEWELKALKNFEKTLNGASVSTLEKVEKNLVNKIDRIHSTGKGEHDLVDRMEAQVQIVGAKIKKIHSLERQQEKTALKELKMDLER